MNVEGSEGSHVIEENIIQGSTDEEDAFNVQFMTPNTGGEQIISTQQTAPIDNWSSHNMAGTSNVTGVPRVNSQVSNGNVHGTRGGIQNWGSNSNSSNGSINSLRVNNMGVKAHITVNVNEPPIWCGRSDSTPVRSFVTQYERFADRVNWTSQERINNLKGYLTGKADDWHESLDIEDLRQWSHLKRKLIQDHSEFNEDRTGKKDRRGEYYTGAQKLDESEAEFGRRLIKLARKAKIGTDSPSDQLQLLVRYEKGLLLRSARKVLRDNLQLNNMKDALRIMRMRESEYDIERQRLKRDAKRSEDSRKKTINAMGGYQGDYYSEEPRDRVKDFNHTPMGVQEPTNYGELRSYVRDSEKFSDGTVSSTQTWSTEKDIMYTVDPRKNVRFDEDIHRKVMEERERSDFSSEESSRANSELANPLEDQLNNVDCDECGLNSMKNNLQICMIKAESKNPKAPKVWKKICNKCKSNSHDTPDCWQDMKCGLCGGKHPAKRCFKKCKWCGSLHGYREACLIEEYFLTVGLKGMPKEVEDLLDPEIKEKMQLNRMGDQLKRGGSN